jgi:hypothetical protein
VRRAPANISSDLAGTHAPSLTKGKGQTPAIVPAGLPAWVTAEYIDETIRVWQPYSKTPLTPADAIEIIMNMSRLLDVLME